MNKLLIVLVFLISGCGQVDESMKVKNEVTKTKDGVSFTMRVPGKMSYKDKDIEAEIDTRSQSLLRTLVEGVVMQGLKSDR